MPKNIFCSPFTAATGTGIIENAIQSEYIKLNKDVYTVLPKGEYLIETLSLCKKLITVDTARSLLETGRAESISGFISKNGKPFSASLRLENGRVVFDFGRQAPAGV